MIAKEKLERLAVLKAQKEELDAQLKEIKRQMAELNKSITSDFIDDNCQNMTLPGLGQFYLFTQEIPSIKDEVLCKDWVEKKGDLDLVTAFHAGKFRAYYRSLVESGEEVPPGTDVFVKQEVRIKKA